MCQESNAQPENNNTKIRGMEYTVQKISEKLSRNEKCLSKKCLYHEGKENKLFKVILDAWFEEFYLFFSQER